MLFDILRSGQKIFHVHIPKTGGTSLANMVADELGVDRCAFHAESILLSLECTNQHLADLRLKHYVSAHLPFDFAKVHFLDHGFKAVTILRNPLEQFFSHIKHIRRASVCSTNSDLQRLAALSLDEILFDEIATPLFADPQAKQMLGTYMQKGLNLKEAASWIRHNYYEILFTEDLDTSITDDFLTKIRHDNISPRTALQVSEIFLKRFADICRFDITLYHLLRDAY